MGPLEPKHSQQGPWAKDCEFRELLRSSWEVMNPGRQTEHIPDSRPGAAGGAFQSGALLWL